MKRRVVFLSLLILVCSLSATAQAVMESESSARLTENGVVIDLVVNAERASQVNGSVDLLSPDNSVRSSLSLTAASLNAGKTTVGFPLAIEKKGDSVQDDLGWCRLRYRVGSAEGVVSMTQLLRDLFELRIIATSNVFSGMTYRVRSRATNPHTDMPVADVELRAVVSLGTKSEETIKLETTGKTGTDGFANLDFAIPLDAKLDGDGTIRVVGSRNYVIREATEELNALSDDVQFVTLADKPIYQPGQVFNLRGIAIKGAEAKTIVSGIEVEFRISDEDDTLLYREKATLSAFGVAAMSWTIPQSAKLGEYSVEIKDADNVQIGGHRFKVSRYDLPNFTVEAKTGKEYYLPGDKSARVDVSANYLFGKPVTRGKVRVVEETNREWNWKEQRYDIEEGQVKQGETDERGGFAAFVDLSEAHEDLEDEKWQKHKDLRFTAYFTDLTTNKTEQRRFDVRITREPIHVYLTTTEGENTKLPTELFVSTFYANGKAAECDVEIRASVEDEDKFKLLGQVRTNQYGVGKLVVNHPDPDADDDDLDIALTATDGYGRRGRVAENVWYGDDDGIVVNTSRIIHKPGEPIEIQVRSTIESGIAHVDIVSGWSVLDSRFVKVNKGRGRLSIPYSEAFKGKLTITAFMEERDSNEVVTGSRGVIFPFRQGITVDADADKAIYKPGENATVRFGVTDLVGRAVESALGIVVFDKAVEERARTDAEFGGMWRNLGGWLGYGESYGSVTLKSLNELDLSKPIPDELQLVAELMFRRNYYYPNIFRSRNYDTEARTVFRETVDRQFAPVRAALAAAYQASPSAHPVDVASMKSILGRAGIMIDEFRDPWGTPYMFTYTTEKSFDVAKVVTLGPDKRVHTADDFEAYSERFNYFTPTGKAIDAAVSSYTARTGKFIRDEQTLFAEMGVSGLTDRFGRPYHFDFNVVGRKYQTVLRSTGPDGVFEKYYYNGDDFQVWANEIDYFAATEANIIRVQSSLVDKPTDESGFRLSLKAADIDFDALRDGWGQALYIVATTSSRYTDKASIETVQRYGDRERTQRTIITPVTQDIVTFMVRSPGPDSKIGTSDDVTLMQIVHVMAERSKETPTAPFKPVAHRNGNGSITGVVTDSAGAVIPGVVVSATNDTTQVSKSATTDDAGRYVILGLAAGTYTVRVAAVSGFAAHSVDNVIVLASKTSSVNIEMATTVDATVTVSAGAEVLETSASYASTTITSKQVASLPLMERGVSQFPAAQNSTPRLRNYFPETLFWQPELVTGTDGRTTVNFTMADNITTWKIYTIASTKDGRIGVAENEVTAFQSFFVDLDPPRYLTAGDQIFLPTQVRNYTGRKQRVDVSMAAAPWYSLLGPERRQVDVGVNETQNAVFGFEARSPVTDGKQRVTAIAQAESDAIEKPVTVRPNGEEIVRTESKVFESAAKFEINYPANALPKTQRAELKIYPNLFSHVAESVEGLLQRPYGCGEQTISSTYPNVMILKFIKADSPLRRRAQRYLQSGYERLIGYQVADGGFTYWGGKDTSDVALTAYALRFLNDADEFIAVDASIVRRAEEWLVGRQAADGSWTKTYRWETGEDHSRTKLITSYVARALAMNGSANADSRSRTALANALTYLKTRNAQIDEPYALALFGLASLDSGDTETAKQVAAKLEKMAIAEGSTVYWNLETNTPFYGWGTAGRIETTALVLQLLTGTAKLDSRPPTETASRGLMFLLKNKDRYGVWYSTQTTINVLDAFLAMLGADGPAKSQTINVAVNGVGLPEITIQAGHMELVNVDIQDKLTASANTIEVRSSTHAPVMAQTVAAHYIDWRDSQPAAPAALRLDYKCDKTNAAIMEEVSCSVEAERVGFKGYGMLLAEIGTPPGADVSRESLEKALESDWSLSRYDVLPDRIVLYMWSRAGGTKFNFKFKPRYGVNAQTPASIVYDYYNPDAKATTPPLHFVAR